MIVTSANIWQKLTSMALIFVESFFNRFDEKTIFHRFQMAGLCFFLLSWKKGQRSKKQILEVNRVLSKGQNVKLLILEFTLKISLRLKATIMKPIINSYTFAITALFVIHSFNVLQYAIRSLALYCMTDKKQFS